MDRFILQHLGGYPFSTASKGGLTSIGEFLRLCLTGAYDKNIGLECPTFSDAFAWAHVVDPEWIGTELEAADRRFCMAVGDIFVRLADETRPFAAGDFVPLTLMRDEMESLICAGRFCDPERKSMPLSRLTRSVELFDKLWLADVGMIMPSVCGWKSVVQAPPSVTATLALYCEDDMPWWAGPVIAQGATAWAKSLRERRVIRGDEWSAMRQAALHCRVAEEDAHARLGAAAGRHFHHLYELDTPYALYPIEGHVATDELSEAVASSAITAVGCHDVELAIEELHYGVASRVQLLRAAAHRAVHDECPHRAYARLDTIEITRMQYEGEATETEKRWLDRVDAYAADL